MSNLTLFWLPITFISFIFFGGVFKFFQELYQLTAARAAYANSTIHAVIAVVWTIVAAWNDPNQQADGESTWAEAAWLATSLGYYLLDSVVVFCYVPDLEAGLHHFACVFGQLAALLTNRCGYNLVLNMLIAELSTPFLNTVCGEFLPKGSTGYVLCQAAFAVLFLFGRVVIAPFLAYELLFSSAPELVKAACVILMVLSVYWSARVIREILDALSPKAKHDSLIETGQYHGMG